MRHALVAGLWAWPQRPCLFRSTEFLKIQLKSNTGRCVTKQERFDCKKKCVGKNGTLVAAHISTVFFLSSGVRRQQTLRNSSIVLLCSYPMVFPVLATSGWSIHVQYRYLSTLGFLFHRPFTFMCGTKTVETTVNGYVHFHGYLYGCSPVEGFFFSTRWHSLSR
jgi:hypothetical protein